MLHSVVVKAGSEPDQILNHLYLAALSRRPTVEELTRRNDYVRKHGTTRALYAERLAAQGVIATDEAAGIVEQYRSGLDAGKQQARASLGMVGNKYTVDWS